MKFTTITGDVEDYKAFLAMILSGTLPPAPEEEPPSRKALLDEVKKYNEHHDELGRFTYADGGGGDGSGTLSTDAPVEGGGGGSKSAPHIVRSIAFGKTQVGEKREKAIEKEREKLAEPHDIVAVGKPEKNIPEVSLTEERIRANLEKYFGKGSEESYKWYDKAARFAESLVGRYPDIPGLTAERVIAIIAATSPNNPWDDDYETGGKRLPVSNQLMTEKVLDALNRNPDIEVTERDVAAAKAYVAANKIQHSGKWPEVGKKYKLTDLAKLDPMNAASFFTPWPKKESEGGEGWGWGGKPMSVVASMRVILGENPEDVYSDKESKVRSFYNNIMRSHLGEKDDPDVTIDIHHLRAMYDRPDLGTEHYKSALGPAPRYELFRRITADLAKKHGLSPKQYQARVWYAIRDETKVMRGLEKEANDMAKAAKRAAKDAARAKKADAGADYGDILSALEPEERDDLMLAWWMRFQAHEGGYDVDDDPIFGPWDEDDEAAAREWREPLDDVEKAILAELMTLKFNENHDPDTGRFTSGDGVGGEGDASEGAAPRTISRTEARDLLARIQFKGGFSYRPVNHSSPTKGYVVSPYESRSESHALADVTEEALVDYALKNADLLEKEDHYFGAWNDNGRVYLDVSITKQSADEAIKLAQEHDQIAVWDIEKGEQVVVNAAAMSGGARKALVGLIEILKWDEEQHPRGEGGRFVNAGGAGGNAHPAQSAALGRAERKLAKEREERDKLEAMFEGEARGREQRLRERLAAEQRAAQHRALARRADNEDEIVQDRQFGVIHPRDQDTSREPDIVPYPETPAYNPDADPKQAQLFAQQFASAAPAERQRMIDEAEEKMNEARDAASAAAHAAENAADRAQERLSIARDASRGSAVLDMEDQAREAAISAEQHAVVAHQHFQVADANLNAAIRAAGANPQEDVKQQLEELDRVRNIALDRAAEADRYKDRAAVAAERVVSIAGGMLKSPGSGSGGGSPQSILGSSFLLHSGKPITATPGTPTPGLELNPQPDAPLGVAQLSNGAIGSPDVVRGLVHGVTDPTTAKNVGGGVSGTVKVNTVDGQTLFVKPAAGISNVGRHGIVPGGDMQREVAAQTINEALGAPVLMPAIAIREDIDIGRGPEIGTVQEFLGKDKIADYSLDTLTSQNFTDGSKPVDAGAFDFIIGNADRHQNQGGRMKDGSYVFWDHGLSLGEHGIDQGGNIGIQYMAQDKKVSDTMAKGIDDIVENRDGKWKTLKQKLLASVPDRTKPDSWRKAVHSVRHRARRIRDNGYRVPSWSQTPWFGSPEASADTNPFPDDND